MKVAEAIKTVGFGLSGDIGGLPRSTYYTPDGRVLRAIAAWREYVVKDKEGNVTGSGTRDANLDKGWLLAPPAVLKPFCRGCDGWHETLAEVEQCSQKRAEFIASVVARANQEKTDAIVDLERQVAELKALISKRMGDIKQ